MSAQPAYPLSAIVGQEDLVEALLVCAVAPVVGGVLVRGERGTAKSTAVRALAPMLGPHAPLIDLPLGATLDRLVGTLDVRAALEGEHRIDPGLLHRADGGVLYVDEVNLLPDHLVDTLLDAAARGEVTIERDGVSVVQAARFLLVGTMNPEEGELRPQLLDRFGLGVEIRGARDAATRVQIVKRRLAYDADPVAFAGEWAGAEAALAARIAGARERIGGVRIADRELLRISAVCTELDLDGIRGDLVCAHAARALAALDDASHVADEHVERAAHLALRHRLRRDPLAPPPGGGRDPAIDDALDSPEERDAPPAENAAPSPETAAGWAPSPDLVPPPLPEPTTPPAPPRAPQALPARVPELALVVPRARRRGAPADLPVGGRSHGGALARLDARPAVGEDPIAVLPTILAALRGDARPQTAINGGGRGALLCLVVDMSGSMAARARLARVKGALEVTLRRAHARRDVVAVVGFGGDGARTLVAPGVPLEQAAAAISALPAGGRTPLAAGIEHGAALLAELCHHPRHAGRAKVAVLLTDGRAADSEGRARLALHRIVCLADRTVVVDLEEGGVRLGLAVELATAAGADLTRLVPPDLRSAA